MWIYNKNLYSHFFLFLFLFLNSLRFFYSVFFLFIYYDDQQQKRKMRNGLCYMDWVSKKCGLRIIVKNIFFSSIFIIIIATIFFSAAAAIIKAFIGYLLLNCNRLVLNKHIAHYVHATIKNVLNVNVNNKKWRGI